MSCIKFITGFIVVLLSSLVDMTYAQSDPNAHPIAGQNTAMMQSQLSRIRDLQDKLSKGEGDGKDLKVRPDYLELFDKTEKLVSANKLDDAKKNLAKLQGLDDQNPYEKAYTLYLDYIYNGMAGNAELEVSDLYTMIKQDREYLPSEIYVSEGMRLFSKQVNALNYGGALDTVKWLREDPNAKPELDKEGAIIKKLEAMAAGDKPFMQKISIGDEGKWTIKLLRPSFYLENVIGDVSSVNIDCDNKKTSVPFTADSFVTIPASWTNCLVTLNAKPNTIFDFIQTPATAAKQ